MLWLQSKWNKQALWKRLLSFFMPIRLRQWSSDKQELSLILNSGRLQLDSGDATYSLEADYHSFREVFDQLDWSVFKVKRSLILGGGLCSIPILLTDYSKEFTAAVVEWDQSLIDIAKEELPSELLERIRFHCADALEFVPTLKGKFQLITMDLFDGDLVPVAFFNRGFISSMLERLDHQGLLVMSIVKKPKVGPSQLSLLEEVLDSFTEKKKRIETSGNFIYLIERGNGNLLK